MRTLKIVARHDGSQMLPHFDFYAANPPMRRWLPIGEVVEVKFGPEWLSEIRAGVLVAADEATAKLAGVKFDAGKVKSALMPAKPATEK